MFLDILLFRLLDDIISTDDFTVFITHVFVIVVDILLVKVLIYCLVVFFIHFNPFVITRANSMHKLTLCFQIGKLVVSNHCMCVSDHPLFSFTRTFVLNINDFESFQDLFSLLNSCVDFFLGFTLLQSKIIFQLIVNNFRLGL